jgi:hypothetical protein
VLSGNYDHRSHLLRDFVVGTIGWDGFQLGFSREDLLPLFFSGELIQKSHFGMGNRGVGMFPDRSQPHDLP